MANLGPLIRRLSRTRAGFESAARQIPAKDWRTPPKSGRWSAAEIVAHVTMVETLISGAMASLARKPLVRVPVWKRFHVPVWLASLRFVRVESPVPLDTLLLDDCEPMLARLAEQRAHTMSLIKAAGDRNLRAYRLRHPFLGSLNYYSWFRTLAEHDARHTKQMDENVQAHKMA